MPSLKMERYTHILKGYQNRLKNVPHLHLKYETWVTDFKIGQYLYINQMHHFTNKNPDDLHYCGLYSVIRRNFETRGATSKHHL